MFEIHHQLTVNASAQAVFDAFTRPDGLNAWWTLESSGQPITHTHYRLYFGPEYDWLANVVAVEQNHKLTWSLIRAMDDWMPTQFGFVLTPQGAATKVQFFHVGWLARNEHFAITNYCWAQLLSGLKRYVESGVVIPFTLRN